MLNLFSILDLKNIFTEYNMNNFIERCVIPQVWCGNGPKPAGNKYSHRGTRNECMKKGYGAGMYNERRKTLTKDSLYNIPYVGEKTVSKLNKYHIYTLNDLYTYVKGQPSSDVKKMLKRVTKKADNTQNTKAYNSIIAYLYRRDSRLMTKLPTCIKI